MKYTCSKCNRTIKWREGLLFCPFCGSAYQTVVQNAVQPAVQAEPIAATRIVVGSDSERTIQEKYWKEAQTAITDCLTNLKKSLPRFSLQRGKTVARDGTLPEPLPRLRPREVSELSRCTSLIEFRPKFEAILSNARKTLGRKNVLLEMTNEYTKENRKIAAERKLKLENGTWSADELEDEFSIDVHAEAAYIEETCMKIVAFLGSRLPGQLCPRVIYNPNSTQWLEEYIEDEDIDEDQCQQAFQKLPQYAAMWKAIEDSSATIISALASNGLFSLSYIRKEAEENFDPAQCAEDLQKLKNCDYDPLFGESPESFVQAYFDGLVNLIDYCDHLPNEKAVMESSPAQKQHMLKLELDTIKLEALQALVDEWFCVLMRELDQLYQSQTKDMLHVCNAIRDIRTSTGKKEVP